MKNKLIIIICTALLLFACTDEKTTKVKHEIPEPASAGAKIFEKFCANCHAPPRIKSHKSDEWRNIVERMQIHRLKKAYHLLTDEQRETLLLYLEKHAS